MKKVYILLFILLFSSHAFGQNKQKTKNLIIVTLDGYRWQEVFNGANKSLLFNKKFVHQDSTQLSDAFWAKTKSKRRRKLMPFFWTTVAKQGQIYGNRNLGNKVNVKNPYWFSYPGYNEIFTGYPDKEINSNNYPPNPNTNVLEYINKQPNFQGKIAAFGSWEAFSNILNQKRSQFPINAGFENVKHNLNGQPLTETQKVLNRVQHHLVKHRPASRLDGATFAMAMTYFKINHPKVFFIGFNDPDGLGHEGRYDLYLKSAHYIDAMIHQLWNYLQSKSQYKNKTTLFVTVDHGRGRGDEWTSHGCHGNGCIKYSNQTWFAVMGPDTPATGVIKTHEQIYNDQFAQTLAHLLGFNFQAKHPIGQYIKSVFK